VTIGIGNGRPTVYDAYGNAIATQGQGSKIALPVCDTPLFVTGTTIAGVAEREFVETPVEKASLVLDFDQAAQFKVVSEPSKTLEASWDYPRLKGDFAVDFVKEDGSAVVRVELKDDADPRKLLQRYVELALAQPIVLKDRVRAFTVRTKGNGGWGRVMFELVDAEDRVWTSCGNQYAGSCNASDNRGNSYVSFDGWQSMTIALPGQFPAPDVNAYWSSTSDWWPENTPEWRQQEAAQAKARQDYEKAKAEFPAKQQAYASAKADFIRREAEYKKAQADYTQEQKAHKDAVVAAKRAKQAYERAKAAHDKDLKAGKTVGDAPQPPQEPKAPLAPAVQPPGEAPTAPVLPKDPGAPRNYGIARITYPVKLTKVIVAMPQSILYVDQEVPVRNRTIYLDSVGAIPLSEWM
jgi:hypothetical protein